MEKSVVQVQPARVTTRRTFGDTPYADFPSIVSFVPESIYCDVFHAALPTQRCSARPARRHFH